MNSTRSTPTPLYSNKWPFACALLIAVSSSHCSLSLLCPHPRSLAHSWHLAIDDLDLCRLHTCQIYQPKQVLDVLRNPQKQTALETVATASASDLTGDPRPTSGWSATYSRTVRESWPPTPSLCPKTRPQNLYGGQSAIHTRTIRNSIQNSTQNRVVFGTHPELVRRTVRPSGLDGPRVLFRYRLAGLFI